MSEPTLIPPAPPVPVQPQKKGFAVTALVLGIVAILGSWIPFLSIGSILIGLVGLIFGVIALIKAVKGTAGGKAMAIVGSALSALAIIFGIVSTSAGVLAVDEAVNELNEEIAASTEPVAEATDGATTEEATAEESEEATAEETETDAGAEGTRDNPFPAGSVIGTDEIEVSFGDANWDANDIVADENQFNDAAPEGSTYVLLPVTFTNVASTEAVTPWLELSVSFVAADGRSFDEASAVIPESLMDIDDLYEGGTGEGNFVYAIPTDVQEGGVWAVELGWFSDTAFVEAR